MLTHDSLWDSTQSTIHSAFHSLPRAIKSLPVLEAMLRPDSNGIYEAIFEVETDLEDGDEDAAGSGSSLSLSASRSRPSELEAAWSRGGLSAMTE